DVYVVPQQICICGPPAWSLSKVMYMWSPSKYVYAVPQHG
mgnify:CR=1